VACSAADGRYRAGGIVTQVKQPKKSAHRSLEVCMSEPGNFLLSDFSKIERPQLLHVAFQALEVFVAKNDKFPAPGNREDAATFITMFNEVNAGQVRNAPCTCCANLRFMLSWQQLCVLEQKKDRDTGRKTLLIDISMMR
jgi:hypothetical protein